MSLPVTGAGPSAGGSYVSKVLSYSPIAYWVLNESAGGTAADKVNSPAQDGAYTGVDLANALGPDGVNSAPLFDGANDYVDIYSAAFNTAFNGSEGTAMIWTKVFNVGVWTDGNERWPISLYVDANNSVIIRNHSANNTIRYTYSAGGTTEAQGTGGQVSVAWQHVAMTWSKTADKVIYYLDGAQTGAVDTGLGNWAGNLLDGGTVIGASSTGPLNVYYGWLAHCAVWDSALAPGVIADLADPLP